MILTFSQKSIWLAYFHGHVTETLRYKSFLGLREDFLIPHEHPLRGDLLLLILLWENLIYHSNFNRKLKTHFLPPKWSFSKSFNSRLLHFRHLSIRYHIWPILRPFYQWPFWPYPHFWPFWPFEPETKMANNMAKWDIYLTGVKNVAT